MNTTTTQLAPRRMAPPMTRDRLLAYARAGVTQGLLVLVVEPGRNPGLPRTKPILEGSKEFYFHMDPRDAEFGLVSGMADLVLHLKPAA